MVYNNITFRPQMQDLSKQAKERHWYSEYHWIAVAAANN